MNKNRMFEEFQRYGTGPENRETLLVLPREIGEGYRREVPLGPGLKLYIEHYALKERMKARVITESVPLGISVCTSGRLNWIPCPAESGGEAQTFETRAGQFDLSLSRTRIEEGVIDCLPHDPISLVSLLVEPGRPGCPAHAGEAADLFFSEAAPNPAAPFFSSNHRFCPAMDMAARQVMNCTLDGRAKGLFLRAKAMEILALALAGFERNRHERAKSDLPGPGGRPGVTSAYSPGPGEIKKLAHAKAILKARYADPPTLARLARQTGLNQTKIKKGFRHLFGTTVSAYVLDQRMARAVQLLTRGHTTVSEVAFCVGYANRAHFTRAFTRCFGYPPVTLLKQAFEPDRPGISDGD